MVPRARKVLLLADRGFGWKKPARACRRQGFGCIVHIEPKVQMRVDGFQGNLADCTVHKDISSPLKDVDHRQKDGVQQNTVVQWLRNLPNHRGSCWFLMTSLEAGRQRSAIGTA